jgi:large subunit ribosomal protein L3
MAGHMGDERVTVKNLRVFQADPVRGVLLLEGSVPGAVNGLVQVKKTAKKGS